VQTERETLLNLNISTATSAFLMSIFSSVCETKESDSCGR